MNIERIKLSRHFMRDDGTEETIELTTVAMLIHESAVRDAVAQLRVELEQFDETGMIVDDIRAQTESARSELASVIRQLNNAIDSLKTARNVLINEGQQVKHLDHAIETAEATLDEHY